MRILTTLSYYRPYVSGLTVCAQRLIDGLAETEFEFTVLTSRHRRDLPLIETKNMVVVRRLPVWGVIGKVPVMPGYLPILIKELRRTDLVWIHLPQAEGLITAMVAKLSGKRVVTTLHCLPLLPSGWQRVLFQKLFDLVNNLTIRLADKVVYYTKDYAENTTELWHFPEKSEYILPPIPGVRSMEYGVRRRKKNKDTVVGFAGRVAEDKGLEYLIEAIQLVKESGKDIRLVMAGAKRPMGESRYAGKIDSLIDESGVDVEFLGLIDPEKMGRFYELIDILVLPSVNRTEAFGMVQAEAMKFGVSVIASNLPGVRIPVRLTKGGMIVAPGNSTDLVVAIQMIRSTPFHRQSIALLAEKYFSAEDTFIKYLNIIERQIATSCLRVEMP